MAADFYIARNDTTSPIKVTLKQPSGAVINLTGATVKFVMRAPNSQMPKVFADAEIVDAANGIVQYTWLTGDTSYPGTYYVSWVITFQTGKIQTIPNRTRSKLTVTNI